MRVACPECSKLVSEKATSCPGCGYEFTSESMAELIKEEKDAKRGFRKGCVIAITVFAALILVIYVVGALVPDSQTNSRRYSGSNNRVESSNESQKWFQGGTLHNASISEWKRASRRNKLATAADWLSSTLWDGHLNTLADFDRLRVKAQMLVNGIDEAVAVDGELPFTAREVGALLVTMSNDLGPY